MTIFWRGDQLCLARLIQNVERAVAVDDGKSKPPNGKQYKRNLLKWT